MSIVIFNIIKRQLENIPNLTKQCAITWLRPIRLLKMLIKFLFNTEVYIMNTLFFSLSCPHRVLEQGYSNIQNFFFLLVFLGDKWDDPDDEVVNSITAYL
jgi:hypothetical protein